MNLIRLIFVLLVGLLVGCSSTGDKNLLPQEGRKMIDIYRSATADNLDGAPMPQEEVKKLCGELENNHAKSDCEQKANEMGLLASHEELEKDAPLVEKIQKPQSEPLYVDYTRTEANEIEVLFPRLPNPDIEIYIYPHLATENQVPVPGYTTVIPLHEKVQYAMPGEKHQSQH